MRTTAVFARALAAGAIAGTAQAASVTLYWRSADATTSGTLVLQTTATATAINLLPVRGRATR
jgi:hypothetical protein